jgi:putative transposase
VLYRPVTISEEGIKVDPIELIQDGKLHRYFRATKKLDVPHLVSHITQRAAGREPLFIEDDDYLAMLVLLKEVSSRYSLRMFAFCLMPNHIHMLFSPTEKNLYDAMKFLFSRYAMRFNKKYERRGHLFGAPYRQAICLDDSYLLVASLYIHLNPVRAGLAKFPSKYRWSSCGFYYKDEPPESFLDPDFILGMLQEGDRAGAREIYRNLMRQGRKIETTEIMEREDSIDKFRSKLGSLISKFFTKSGGRSNVAQLLGLDETSSRELDKLIAEVGDSKWQRDPTSRDAKKYVAEQLIARGYKRAEIAERLGVSRKTLYNILNSYAAGY